MNERVLVTGITGYIGQHCGAELLRQGYEVVGTVRSQSKAESTRSALAEVASVDKLSFVEADLLSDDGWDEAVRGCTFVLHVASPFVFAEPKDENELIAPAVDGTTRVITAAQRAGVRRLVLTSSLAAMIAGRDSGRYGPDAWSDTDAKIGAYSKSKTLAERAAWDLGEGNDMELAVINPGAVLGPSLGAALDAQSVAMMTDMIGGKMPMIPDLTFGMVDVRDVARLHVKAMTADGAAGKRFIAATAEPIALAAVADILRDAGYEKVPSRKAPNVLMKLMGIFDSDVRGMVPMLGKQFALDNSATFDVLAWEPTPVNDSVTEMAAALSA
jgi:dihydroflavonol-4-reductase